MIVYSDSLSVVISRVPRIRGGWGRTWLAFQLPKGSAIEQKGVEDFKISHRFQDLS